MARISFWGMRIIAELEYRERRAVNPCCKSDGLLRPASDCRVEVATPFVYLWVANVAALHSPGALGPSGSVLSPIGRG